MTLSRRELTGKVIAAVAGWEGVESAPHRFGGVEWRIGRVEIGHAHLNGMIDIPYTIAIRDILVAGGRAEPHHILPDTGWISFTIREDADIDRAIWLARLSYVHKGMRRLSHIDFSPMIAELDPDDALRALVIGTKQEISHES